jgi:hypothetical protein
VVSTGRGDCGESAGNARKPVLLNQAIRASPLKIALKRHHH